MRTNPYKGVCLCMHAYACVLASVWKEYFKQMKRHLVRRTWERGGLCPRNWEKTNIFRREAKLYDICWIGWIAEYLFGKKWGPKSWGIFSSYNSHIKGSGNNPGPKQDIGSMDGNHYKMERPFQNATLSNGEPAKIPPHKGRRQEYSLWLWLCKEEKYIVPLYTPQPFVNPHMDSGFKFTSPEEWKNRADKLLLNGCGLVAPLGARNHKKNLFWKKTSST